MADTPSAIPGGGRAPGGGWGPRHDPTGRGAGSNRGPPNAGRFQFQGVQFQGERMMSEARNQRRLQQKVQRGLLAPYHAVAARTTDKEAAAAIRGLIRMV